jgi:hypothetical protein
MNSQPNDLWKALNRLDEEVSSIYVATELLDACAEHITSSEEDAALNCLIGAKAFLSYLQTKLDLTLREVWDKTNTKLPND